MTEREYQQQLNRVMVSPHFSLAEFACKHCGTVKLHPRLVELLEALRETIGGKPIVITSGYRCPERNRQVGGAPQSRHLYGDAVDIAVAPTGLSIDELAALARRVGFTGIGFYDDGHLHVDCRPGAPVAWDERKKGGR